MAWVNENFAVLEDSYLFSQVAHKVAAYSAVHPEKKIIRLGIGDVTLPLAPVVVEAMQKAAAEMGVKETFRGYGPEQGYGFLQEALVKYYAGFGVVREASEVFISDGAKSDCGNITDIFDDANGHQHYAGKKNPVHGGEPGERVPAHAGSGCEGGHHLSVFSQQSYRGRLFQSAAERVGGLRPSE